MVHITHKSWVGIVGATIILVAAIMTLSVSTAVNAAPARGLDLTPEAHKAVACFAYARAQELPWRVQQVYLKRIGKAAGTAGAVYHLGYIEGIIAAHGTNRVVAAKHFYKLMGCTINESI